MKRIQIKPLPLLLILTLLFVGSYGIYVIVITTQAKANFHRSEEADGWDGSYSAMLRKVKNSDFDLKIAGLDGEITVTAPYALSYTVYGMKHTVKRGTEITTDFVSISIPGRGKVRRMVTLNIDGHSNDVTMPAAELSRLYRRALKQNGLAEQFSQDFGAPLSRQTARNALRAIDQQLYDRGILLPRDYPFDQNMLMSLLVFGVFGLPILMVLFSVLWTMWMEQLKYRKYLQESNRLSKLDWEQKSGTLPQFESLHSSGISMDALPERKKPSFLDTLKGLFRPDKQF